MSEKDFEFEERAAIIQYCGNVSREEAERLARQQIEERRRKSTSIAR